jgi:hypothetical protein
VDAIPLVEADGTTNVSFSLFFISFTLLVSWVVLQVTLVVLLDNFVRASAAVDHEQVPCCCERNQGNLGLYFFLCCHRATVISFSPLQLGNPCALCR